MDEKTKKIADSFGCRYQVFEKGTSPELAQRAYMQAYRAGKNSGFQPALLVLDEYVTEQLEAVSQSDYDKNAVMAGCGNNGERILKELFEEFTQEYSKNQLQELIGTETSGEVLHQFTGFLSFTDRMLGADTLLLEFPAENPWDLAAYLPLGGWNECPAPEEMIEICKYWYEKYQAVPAVFTHDVMEFYAPAKLNGNDSLEAAKEHFAFCTDRIFQGTRSCHLSELAAGLEQSDVWYFWWD